MIAFSKHHQKLLLTDGCNDEHDEEGVEHGHDGRSEGREDVLEGCDAPKKPYHAARGRGKFREGIYPKEQEARGRSPL